MPIVIMINKVGMHDLSYESRVLYIFEEEFDKSKIDDYGR